MSDADESAIEIKKHILVMDDDEMLQVGLQSFLEHLGYRVSVAENGNIAADLYRSCFRTENAFAAVILDLTIPGGLGGEQALALLLAIDPDVRAIISSGYQSNASVVNYRSRGFRGRLDKPFQAKDLTRALNEALEG